MSSLSASTPSSSSSLASPPPWILRIRTSSSYSSPTRLSNSPPHRRPQLRGCCRVVCSGAGGGGGSSLSGPQFAAKDLKFVLHDALDSGGVDTTFAREGRQGFLSQIEKMSDIERETSISINRFVDLGKAALYIAAEDDALISHSSVPLPVDAFRDRLDDLSMGYFSSYNSSLRSSPESFLDSLERYLYIKKGFRRSNTRNPVEPRALYLHSVWNSLEQLS
uniref:Uncharacterized protein LOC107412908 n=1 Tax=Rhizophora mucronata TaxID=61149 RepID=A0A2P2JS43_RHIMU